MYMEQMPFLKFWAPQLHLNTDIIPIEKMKQPENVTLISYDKSTLFQEGVSVKTGQKLAKDLISPYSGKITSLKKVTGLNKEIYTLVSLKVSSKEELSEDITPIKDISETGRDKLLAMLNKLGFDSSFEDNIDEVVINTFDIDPISAVNMQIFRENSKSLNDCITLLNKITNCTKIVVAIPKALQNLAQRACSNDVQISIVKPLYPNGIPEILLKKLFPKNITNKKRIVVDMEHLFLMYTSLKIGKPAQDKVVTLSAPDLSVIKNIQVKIGTPLSEILNNFSITTGNNSKVLLNGPMKGVACYDLNHPVTPSLYSVCIQKEDEIFKFENNPCTNCGKCVAVCPIKLQVNLICRYSEYKIFDECERLDVESCIECGLCAYSCVAHRPLIHYIHHAKVDISSKIAEEQVS